jgi:hypothetical protein
MKLVGEARSNIVPHILRGISVKLIAEPPENLDSP